MHNNDCQLQYHFSSCLLGFVFAFVHSALPVAPFSPVYIIYFTFLPVSVRGAIKKCVKTCEELHKLNTTMGAG